MAGETEYPQLRRWAFILIFSGLALIPLGAIVLVLIPPQPENSLAAWGGLIIIGHSGLVAGVGLLVLEMKFKSRSQNSN